MDMRVDVSGLVRFADGMRNGPQVVAEEMEGAMDRSVGYVAGTARQLVRVRSGATMRTIAPRVVAGPSGVTGTVSARGAARWLEFGRGWVFPRRAKVLSWISESGERVFARFARPAKPQPFMAPALERNKGRIRQEFRRLPGRVFVRLAGRR